MKALTPSIPCALGRRMPPSPASGDALRALRAAVWHQQGIAVIPVEELHLDRDRQFLTHLATRLYGARTATTQQGQPWSEGDIVERGDGETWTVVAAVAHTVVVRRSRDGALATLAQPGARR